MTKQILTKIQNKNKQRRKNWKMRLKNYKLKLSILRQNQDIPHRHKTNFISGKNTAHTNPYARSFNHLTKTSHGGQSEEFNKNGKAPGYKKIGYP